MTSFQSSSSLSPLKGYLGADMSEIIDLGRAPKSPEERKRLLEDYIKKEEIQNHTGLTIIQQKVIDLLVNQRGYPDTSIEINRPFTVSLPEIDFVVKGDIVVTVDGKVALMMKCAINSIESWERYALAFCRTAIDEYQIPFAVVTDSEDYIFIDIINGTTLRGIESIPTYEKLLSDLQKNEQKAFDTTKKERERRILHAFNALRCSDETC